MDKIQLRNITKAYEKGKPVIENLDLQIQDGSFTVLLGPSGCGKSTILRMIAGLEQETGGDILIDGASVKHVEPGDRQIAMVFQNYALYPTMTVRENIEFGLKNLKVPKQKRAEEIGYVAEIVGLTEYLDRKPQKLSGGQRQRVALARAIVKNPSVFLMDEPLSNLDAKLRNQIRTDLIELYRKLSTTFVYVTHDQVEAMSMATEIILLDKGKIMQQGTPAEIYQKPANVFTAKFIGAPPMNILGGQLMETEAVKAAMPPQAHFMGFRAECAGIAEGTVQADENSIALPGTLLTHEMLGDQTIYKVESDWGILQVKTFGSETVQYGDVTVTVPKNSLYWFDQAENRMEPALSRQ